MPKLKQNEVLVKVLYVGVCQSGELGPVRACMHALMSSLDLHTKNGTASGPDGQAITKIKLPHVGGHEGVGTSEHEHGFYTSLAPV